GDHLCAQAEGLRLQQLSRARARDRQGVDPKAVMAELFGKETGTSHGRGGSMHLFSQEHRFYGGYAIVGEALPLAVGSGYAINYQERDEVVMSIFGDGATNIGAFHESLNVA